jgi:aerobic-type carbon monoxide dehydrogenase small subunit (CoxS/CutS family)
MSRIPTNITINGYVYEDYVDASMTLLHYIREVCGLTGTKCGCENGECGACTVIVDGKPVRSCLILAVEAHGSTIITVEGLAKGDDLHPLQQTLVDSSAVQCGYCIPGVLMGGTALLERHPDPTEEQILEALGGHLCRCAGYEAMSDAVKLAAEAVRAE